MTQELTTIVTGTPLELTIAGWLDTKFKKSGSKKTEEAYDDTLRQFRAALQQKGLDLNSGGEDELVQIEFIAQAFSSFSARGKQVAPATINQRLAILSSFYEYARIKKAVRVNPIENVERAKVQAYAGARALDTDTTTRGLLAIDRKTPQGARNYALLSVLLQTGRRLSEVASLQLQHVTVQAGLVTLDFRHAKGNKVMFDTLPKAVSTALLKWLYMHYGNDVQPGTPHDERGVWVSLSSGGRKEKSYGQPMGIQSIADVCEKHFGTSKVHTMRHTFAHTMEQAGAKPSEIQRKLGHSSLATTGIYLSQLSQAENEHADTLAELLGIVSEDE